MVGGVVAVADVSAAGSGGWGGTTDWVVGSDGEETQNYLRSGFKFTFSVEMDIVDVCVCV